MISLRELAESAWRGEASGTFVHPGATFAGLEELAAGLAFVVAFANVGVVVTDDGLVLVDTSSPFHAYAVLAEVRRYRDLPVRAVVYTHGHVDHTGGISAWDDEARQARRPPPEVWAHAALPERFARYALTAGYNAHINQRQFGLPAPVFPSSFRAPDRVYDGERVLEVGGARLELCHARGETDDHTWIWLPQKRALFTGDLFIWAAPNCGNPQKAQRYPREWAAALRRMEALGAEILLPGHGPPILGGERVRQALSGTAELLESIVDQALALMNRGARLDDVIAGVRVDPALLARPYLRPVYDDPEFIVRNVWRLYGGWYDGNPARLKPPRDAELARAVAELAGGAPAVARRAAAAAEAGDLRLAASLAEMAFLAAPDEPLARDVRAAVYQRRAADEPSLMARNLFAAAARETGGR